MNSAALLQSSLYLSCAVLAMAVLIMITAKAPRVLITLFLAQVSLTSGAIGFYPSVLISGVHVYPLDIFTVLLLAVGVVRKLLSQNWALQDTTFALLSAIVVVAFNSSIPLLSLQSSVNHSRQLFLSIGAYFWASSVGKWDQSMLAPFVWVAILGATVQNFLYLKNGFGSASDGYWDAALGWVSARPLESSGALIMLCGFLVLVSRGGPWSVKRYSATAYLAMSLLLSQHRSVWIAGMISVLVLAAVALKGSRQGIFATLPALAVAIPIGLIVFSAVSNSASLVDSAQNSGTLDARFSFWSERMAVARSTIEWLMGGLLGPSPVELDPRFQIEAHNMYIQTITIYGFVGLALLLGTLWLAFPGFGDTQRRTHSVMMISVVVFGFFYTWPAWTFLLLGLSCSYHSVLPLTKEADRQKVQDDPSRSPLCRTA